MCLRIYRWPRAILPKCMYALRFDGQDLYVGGSFYEVNGLPAFGIAKWDGGTWTTLGAGVTTHPINPINPPAVYAIQVNAGSVFVAGNFDTAGAVSANGLARWDGQQWKALNDSLGHPNDPAISAIAVRGNNVYAGGSFTTVAGQPANRIAKWNGSEWSLLGNNASNGVNDSVLAVAIAPDGQVYAGGTFTTASGLTANRIARWDGTKWNALRNGIENGTNPQTLAVRTLAVDTQGNVYVGGEFTQVDGLAANYIARWSDEVLPTSSRGASRHCSQRREPVRRRCLRPRGRCPCERHCPLGWERLAHSGFWGGLPGLSNERSRHRHPRIRRDRRRRFSSSRSSRRHQPRSLGWTKLVSLWWRL